MEKQKRRGLRGVPRGGFSPLLHLQMSQGLAFPPAAEKASLNLGTCGTPLWLLRSRPDQVHGTPVRGGPPPSDDTRLMACDSCNVGAMSVSIRAARQSDVAILHALIRALAEYEKLAAQVVGTAQDLQRELFSERPVIEAVIAWDEATKRARLCAVLSQLLDVSGPPRPLPRRSFRRARGARPRHWQGADSSLRTRCG